MIGLKKLVVIICILLAIFIGMYINQRNQISSAKITAEEVDNIEVYITNIYMWKEVTGEALPKFQDINDAPDKWIWEVVKKNIEKYEGISSEYIQETAKKIFGPSFAKQISQVIVIFNYQNLKHISNLPFLCIGFWHLFSCPIISYFQAKGKKTCCNLNEN